MNGISTWLVLETSYVALVGKICRSVTESSTLFGRLKKMWRNVTAHSTTKKQPGCTAWLRLNSVQQDQSNIFGLFTHQVEGRVLFVSIRISVQFLWKTPAVDSQFNWILTWRKNSKNEDNPDPDFAPIDFDRVLVEVYPSEKDVDQHAQDLFLEINKAEPVKLIDMPGVASAKDRKIINEAVDKLYETYPVMFSPSQRCRVPNVNVDNLRNSLFGSGCIKTHNLTTSKKLYDWILEQNKMVGDKYMDSIEEQSTIAPRAWKKARDNKFFLGLESSWLFT